MRWLLALVGAAVLVAGGWWGLRRIRRPELRVAIDVVWSDPDDVLLVAGIDLALEERDHRAGRWRLKTAHQTVGVAPGVFDVPDPCAHLMLPWASVLQQRRLDGAGGPLLRPAPAQEAATILAWTRMRKHRFVAVPSTRPFDTGLRPVRACGPASLDLVARAKAAGVVVSPYATSGDEFGIVRSVRLAVPEPDVVLLDFMAITDVFAVAENLRTSEFQGPVFLASRHGTPGVEGMFAVRLPLREAPPEFRRRHPNPLTWLAYRETLRLLDAMDARPELDPLTLARELEASTDLADYEAAPAVYVFRNGRVVEDAP